MAELKKLGRYELRRVLGKGAMGVVYEGYDPTLSRRVAVKTILKSVALDDETERSYAERFVREAKAVARFNHPNIVQVFDFGVENEAAYLVMEFIQGRELRDFFTAGERFEAGECIRIMGELLDALEFAHQAGVIHRDVKPANVMLDGQRRVKLADFGVARVQDSDRSAAGTMVGTPAFMSPEQISGGKVDRRTDIFSAGTILYQLLTGEQPFKGEGAWTVAKQIMQDIPPAPSSVMKSVSPVFDAIVDKALAKNPAQRYASASEFATSLRGALGAGASAVSSLPPKPKLKPEARASEAEVEFWRSIQNSTDPNEFEFYLEQFPEGTYSQLARHKIAKLKAPVEAARKAAEETARLEAEAKARHEAEERAKREAEENARRAVEEQAKREAEDRARRATEEKIRQAQALARLKQQEEAARRAKSAADEDATVALPVTRRAPASQAAEPPPAQTRSFAIPAAIAAVVIGGGIAAYLLVGRTPPVPAPVAVPARPEAAPAPAVDVEKIRRETEDRLRKEFAGKAAAERAALEKTLAEKIAAESAAAQKVAQAKGAAEKAAAEKVAAAAVAARVAAEKAAAEKAVAERANAEKANAERAAAEKLAADKAAADKAALEKAAAEKVAADKLAAEKAAAANSVEAQLERFIQRVGRDKVLRAEPPVAIGGAPGMAMGEVVYVNDGSCGPGRIKEVTGGSYSMGSALRPTARSTRCISLADDKPVTAKPAASKPAAAVPAVPAVAAPASSADADAQLERFIQRKGRGKVLTQEPPLGVGAIDPLGSEVVYVNDGSCPPGRIREVTGNSAPGTGIRGRPTRCISLAD